MDKKDRLVNLVAGSMLLLALCGTGMSGYNILRDIKNNRSEKDFKKIPAVHTLDSIHVARKDSLYEAFCLQMNSTIKNYGLNLDSLDRVYNSQRDSLKNFYGGIKCH